MADRQYGKLTDQDRKYINQWVAKQLSGKQPTCPLCQTSQWSLLEHFLELRPYGGGAVIVGGDVYPHFALACKHCGYTALINAVAADVLPHTIAKIGGGDNAK